VNEHLLARLSWSSRRRLPKLVQGDTAESGLVCLAMIASYYGSKVDMNWLRSLPAACLTGMGTQALKEVADHLALAARTTKITAAQLNQLQMPAILCQLPHHYVVLKEIKGRKAIVHDPATGVRQVSVEELGGRLGNTAIELTPTPGFKPRDHRRQVTLSHFWNEASGLSSYIVQLLLLSLLLQGVTLLAPFYVQLVIDESITRQDVTFLNLLAIGFMAVTCLQAALMWFRSWALLYLGSVLSVQMRSNLVRHLLALPLGFFSKRHVGDLMSRYNSTGAVQGFLTTALQSIIADVFMAATTLVAVLLYSPFLTVITLVQLALYTGARILRYRLQKTLIGENLVAQAESDNHLMETMRNMTTVKLFGFETERLGLWMNRNIEATNSSIRLARLNIGFTAFNKLVIALGSIVIVYYGAHLILDGTFTTGMLMAFLAYQGHFVSAGADLVDQFNAYKLLGVNLDRLGDIAMSEPEDARGPAAVRHVAPLKAVLELKDVTFRYATSSQHVLKEVNLTIMPGECVVIVGASGVGKSTLLRLALGLEVPLNGTICYGGHDLRKLGFANYRRMVAAVTQDDRLFSGTVCENITMFSPQPDLERMMRCCHHCNIHETILAMPAAYHSLIGGMGDVLSAGERQRLMLARALYKEPKILFLDEVTSNLDAELDRRINSMLATLDIARLIVSHRQSALAGAGRVFELKGGVLEQRLSGVARELAM